MVTALYRRYRPDTFAEMIGQSQVTEPLMTALRTNRVNHAYLFSGPRGCGKTTSARILARCLNCAEGPTDTPCGVCASCVELSRDGGGSLDVVEIDAASHNGVDDARDIRERAIFAPARDRYKIFILDEAHMVTPQGFNALLKIVEEPPEHVKFIFATTEPEKVIGTIRSRTHHYPFRLVPPAQMLDYVQKLCDAEGVTVAPGVLPLVVRAGGGSPRDTLSLLDQLMAGSEGDSVEYERAVALLGYTHAALLDEVVDAIGVRDAAGAFAAVDRVIQTGQDPRRFVEDLLERLRDLIVVAATSAEGAAAVLRGVPQDELDRMSVQATKFGAAELSRSADIVNAALTEMTGATSPRLHLELMIARILVPSSDASERGALARVERLERRVGVSDSVEGASGGTYVAPQPPVAAQPAPVRPAVAADAPPAAASAGGASAGGASAGGASEAGGPAAPAAQTASAPVGPVTTQQVKDAWPQILDAVQRAKRSAWMVVFTAQVRSLNDDVLSLSFPSDNDVASFRQQGAGQGVSEYLRQAIVDLLGIRVKFIARADGAPPAAAPATVSAVSPDDPSSTKPAATPPATEKTVSDEASPQKATAQKQKAPVEQKATAQKGSAQRAPGQKPPAQASAAVTTTWATVTIPGSGAVAVDDAPRVDERPADVRPADDEVPFDDVPPPETEPPFEPAMTVEPAMSAGGVVPVEKAVAPARVAAQKPSENLVERPSTVSQGRATPAFQEPQRYGESVVREILGASFIEEQPVQPGGTR
ncbi:DNA polymerase III subunit gamma and tau [Diaminobutyricibacter sp. McL0608]|uniref:DNA polymerase III subunit gamma and tau n=1 Tax=Leifsonia sp. McL0608 TaxID=3143537 RepID=UPI0031F2FA73